MLRKPMAQVGIVLLALGLGIAIQVSSLGWISPTSNETNEGALNVFAVVNGTVVPPPFVGQNCSTFHVYALGGTFSVAVSMTDVPAALESDLTAVTRSQLFSIPSSATGFPASPSPDSSGSRRIASASIAGLSNLTSLSVSLVPGTYEICTQTELTLLNQTDLGSALSNISLLLHSLTGGSISTVVTSPPVPLEIALAATVLSGVILVWRARNKSRLQ